MSSDAASLFRKQAIEFHRRGGLRGDVLHITSDALRAVHWLVLAIVAAAVGFVCHARVQRYAAGSAVVLIEQRHEVTASRGGVVGDIEARIGQRVRKDEVLLHLRAQTEIAELAAVEHELDDQLALLLRQPDDRGAREAVLSLRARRDVADAALQRSVLLAPCDGVIVDLRVRTGQAVEAGVSVLALQGEPLGAQVTALMPGSDRPRIHPGMTMRLTIAGFERTNLELRVARVDEQVLGPHEAARAVAAELTDALEIAGPIVLVHARLQRAELRARGVTYRLHHGMQGRAEIAIEQEPLLYAWLPGLREALGDVF